MKKLLGSVTLAITMVAAGQAAADYPTKNISMIVPFSAGGGNDTFVRALQPLIEEQLGQTLVIRNIAGGGGAVGMSRAVASPADGYTLLAASNAMLTLEAMGNVAFTHDDFDFIAKIVEEPYLVAVSSDSPYQDLESLVEAASAGSIRVGSSGVGSSAYITANAIADRTDTTFNLIPYPGGSEAISAAMGGHVEAVVLGGAELRSALESGRLNALATTYAERSDNLPDVPTFQESGYDLTLTVWRGIVGPKGLPDEVEEAWVAAIQQIVEDGSYEETANNLGTELAPLYGEELDAFIDESATIMREAAGDLAQ
ncbi:tripartite tricarboxylate transporter substrate binding protein [Halomonas sp. PAMB 3264]|uniref:Bug family tripartite tricarboxylate transporter substrate binding protein n=1 Tax=unclassified Halomonas TaxID=2609666 RepID=UPI002899A352|nr:MULTISPECIES: tripartite tricarboxylate transporter substrate binding protein [unclassified Halomonas]WNL38203.1 tripartite tricarboxylate transporter substrate binding protein [Halomonas sp. PAMB 3232]WNL41503.1 tripartite tricarboxylate transporter substrate binding protein [Halomonas sp. PAMB 3264]